MNQKAAEKAEAAGLKVVQNACMLVEHRRWK
jgi:predicted CoA-binding protein